jgi:hypothetical protein
MEPTTLYQRIYKLSNKILETISIYVTNYKLIIKINGSILDYESFQHQYIDIIYYNVTTPCITNEFINTLFDLLHEPFPINNENHIYKNYEVETNIDYNNVENPKNDRDDTALFLTHFPNFKFRNIINKKYTPLLLDD